jgi:hypothetical protein
VQAGPQLYEKDVEQGLIDRLQQFLMELGKGFALVARYSQLASSPQLFASQYSLILPSEADLRAELERDRALLEAARENPIE